MADEEKILLKVILHHDQAKTLDPIREHAQKPASSGIFLRREPNGFPGLSPCPSASSFKGGSNR
jgi:hypothetical protein